MDYYVADAHCDYLYGVINSNYHFEYPTYRQSLALPRMKSGKVALQFFAAWIETAQKTPCLHQCISMIDAFWRMLDTYEDLCLLSSKFRPEDGKIACVLTVEGGEAIEGSLRALRVLYRLGVRAMSLTWNENNELAGAALDRGNKGLTKLGHEVVDEMCALGMAIDVSHLSDQGIEDVLKQTDRPIFASHSNARAVLHSERSLPDEFISEIARRGGVVGVNFYPKQLNGKRDAGIQDVIRHMQHVIAIGGPNCCCIGSDFDGMPKYPQGLSSSADFPALIAQMEQAGIDADTIKRIAYDNLRNYMVQFTG